MNSNQMRSYTVKSSAVRSAKKQLGVKAVEGVHFEVRNEGKGFYWVPLTNGKGKNGLPKEKKSETKKEEAPATIERITNGKQLLESLSKTTGRKRDARAARRTDAPTTKPAAKKESSKKENDGILRKSTVESPTTRVREIARDMFKKNPNTRRSEVIAECVRQGIAFYTARTQYQYWLQIHRHEESEKAKKKNSK